MKKILFILFLLVCTASSKNITIATGESTGNYYKVGTQINHNLYNDKATVLKTSGSVENMLLVAKGKADIALVQEDALSMLEIFYKIDGLNRYDLLDIAGYLYTETLHIIVNKNSSIKSIQDLNNKEVSFGSKKSGSSVTATFVEQQYDLNFKEVLDMSIDASLQLLVQNKLDAVFYVTKSPSKLLSQFNNLRLLEAKKPIVENLDIAMGSLAKNTYAFLKKEIKAYKVNTVLVVRKNSGELSKIKKYLSEHGLKINDPKKMKRHILQTGNTLILPQETLDLYTRRYGNSALLRYNYFNKYLDKIKKKPKVSQKLQEINLLVNKIPYVHDSKHWKTEDYWATPLEFMGTGAGDAEDFSLLKLIFLSKVGIDPKKLKIIKKETPLKVAGNSYNENISLAYFYKQNKGPIVLDYKKENAKIYLHKNRFKYQHIKKIPNKVWEQFFKTQMTQKDIDTVFASLKKSK